MNAIIINRPLTKKEIEEIQYLITRETVIFHSDKLPDYFKSYTHTQRIPPITIEEKREINSRIMEEVINFGENKIDGKAITDLFSFEKMSLWHYSKFRTYFSVRKLYYEITQISKLKKRYENLYYFGNQKIVERYFNKNEISFSFVKNTAIHFNHFQIFKYCIFFFLRVFLSFFQIRMLKNKTNIVIDHSIKQKILTIKTLKEQSGNYYLEYLFSKLDSSFVILDDVNVPEKKSSYKFTIKKWHFKFKGRLFGELILLKGIFSKAAIHETILISKKLKTLFKTTDISNFSLPQSIIYEYFKNSYSTLVIYIFKYLAYKNFFSTHHFNTISTIDENSPRIKSILDAAKANKIQTIGIQHGNIPESHIAYMFSKEDGKRKIMTDHTLVWGKYWKRILSENGHYPENSLQIVGHIRTDIIQELMNTNFKIKSLKNINKRIVLFASQPQPDSELRRKAAEDVFLSMKRHPDLYLIIKLHPAEMNDIDYYHSIARSTGLTNYSIVYWEDLYLLLAKSSIVITCFSTVGTEAVYFYKPLIILDHLKQDLLNYHKDGVAYQVDNPEDLSTVINELKLGSKQVNKIAYNRFISKYSYKIDGKVTDRVFSFLRSLSER